MHIALSLSHLIPPALLGLFGHNEIRLPKNLSIGIRVLRGDDCRSSGAKKQKHYSKKCLSVLHRSITLVGGFHPAFKKAKSTIRELC